MNKNRTFETFFPDLIGTGGNFPLSVPAAFNGHCLIRRYRVTIEEIPEEHEVLEARLRDLWGNMWGSSHPQSNRDAMKREAERLGIELE